MESEQQATLAKHEQHSRLMALAAPPPPQPYSQQHEVHLHAPARLERHLDERARTGCSHASTSTSTDSQPLMYHHPAQPPPKKKRGPKAGKKAQLAAAAAAASVSAPASSRSSWTTNSAAEPMDVVRPAASGDPYTFHGDTTATNTTMGCYGGEAQMRPAATRQRPQQKQPNRSNNNHSGAIHETDNNDFHRAEINQQHHHHHHHHSKQFLHSSELLTNSTPEGSTNYQQRQSHMMIAHHNHNHHQHHNNPAQQQQQPQSQASHTVDAGNQLPGGPIIRHQQQVMQQPTDSSYYQQQQQQQQHGYGTSHEPMGPSQQQQYYDQMPAGQFVPQQQARARQYHAADGSFANSHRTSPQHQQVPPPQAPPTASYSDSASAYVQTVGPRQQLIEQRRRMSPNYQQQQPVRHQTTPGRMMAGASPPAEPTLGQQQYHHQPQNQPQLANKQLKPRDQIPAATQFQQHQQQQTYAPFADDQVSVPLHDLLQSEPKSQLAADRSSFQYQSSSPTLLQQHLNRSANQAPSQPQPQPQRIGPPNAGHPHRGNVALGEPAVLRAPQPAGYVQQQQQQQPQVRRAPPPAARFDDNLLINDSGYSSAPTTITSTPASLQPNEPTQQQQAQQQVYHFQPQRGQQQQSHSHAQLQPQPQPQAQMSRQQQRVPHLADHAPAPHLLVGNPTPPLTPTSHCVPQQQQQQQHQQQQARLQAAPATGQPPISDQWLPPSHHHSPGLQHVQPAPTCRQPAHHMAPQQQQQQQQSLRPMMVPKSSPVAANSFQAGGQQQHQPYHHQPSQQMIGPLSVIQHYPASPAPSHTHHEQRQQQPLGRPMMMTTTIVQDQPPSVMSPQTTIASTRLTLPLRDTPLLGPFKLDHDAQLTSKVFHLKPQLFDTLTKSAMMNPNQATVIQELQFRAYLLANSTNNNNNNKQPGVGKTAHHHHQHHHAADSSLLATCNKASRNCNWPELFQLTINQQLVHLDRSKPIHRAVDIFQYCQPGDNILEIQVNDCYCSHEFVLEAVDRPTLKAFMNSCFKSRLLSYENCLQKLRFNFGSPGFLMQPQQQQHGGSPPLIVNEYISEFLPQQQQQGIEQTKVRISMKCPLAMSRIRTPTRGHNCKHLQCFDLESFLSINRDRSQWYCPICYLSIPFNMLQLDQHQMNILRALADNQTTDDILMDSSGQWQTYFAPPQPAAQSSIMHQHQHHHLPHQQHHHQTAKSTGIYHPQAQSNQHHNHNHHQQHILSSTNGGGGGNNNNLIAGQPVVSSAQPLARPMSGPIIRQQQQQQQPHSGIMRTNSPSQNWDKPKHHQSHIEPARRPASANLAQQQHQQQQQQVLCDRGSPSDSGMPPTKRVCIGPPQLAPPSQQPFLPVGKPVDHNNHHHQQQQQQYFNGPDGATLAAPATHQSSPLRTATTTTFVQQSSDNTDDLSPLAAMERTIIQHEMGPPPFDPNNLTSTAPQAGLVKGAPPAVAGPATLTTSITQVASNSPQTALPGSNIPIAVAASAPAAAINHLQAGPANDHQGSSISSPAGRANSLPVASPQQQHTPSRLSIGPDSPMQYASSQVASQTTSVSHPATPVSSSIILAHGGPETPATPSNSGCNQMVQQHPLTNNNSPHVGGGGGGQVITNLAVVDHQPLSNGSASAGSITSSSTMTPSGQSLGSVGMGSDSRCGTAPLQMNGSLGLDDLMIPGGSSQPMAASNSMGNNARDVGGQFKMHSHLMSSSSSSLDEKNEILMGKLMMDSSESLLHRSGGELALALEEAEWKQQLDRGKSEHLANFLNEPMMNKQLNQSSQNQSLHQHQHQQQNQNQNQSNPGANKMLSGGINPSDDENSPNGSSPNQHPDQMNDFNNYLDCDVVDNGSGLPPDDSILDLFER